MTLIISEQGRNASRLEPQTIEREDYLQRYIYENPEAIPLEQYKPDARLLILTREFPTGSGAIDALGVDQEGEVYLIETKLYKNPDKRLVLAQVMDYGASLWKTYGDANEFIATVQARISKEAGNSLIERLRELDLDDEAAEEVVDAMRENVEAGSFRFVILMDRLDRRLKDLIVFINQNSRFDVFGVELEFYEHGELEILIPRWFGAEVKKTVSAGSGRRRRWDEDSYFADAEKRLDPRQLEALRRLYEWSTEHADEVSWGTGARRGSFNPKLHHVGGRSVFTVYSDGELQVNFGWFQEPAQRKYAEALAEGLRRAGIVELPADYQERYPSSSVDVWTARLEDLLEVLSPTLVRPTS